jgi:hypothetical protein
MLLAKYIELLRRDGAKLVHKDSTLMARDTRHTVFYTPFEYVNTSARLVLIGITPGTTQLENSYAALQRALQEGATPEEALRQAKQQGAFSGDLRVNLIKLLRHFRFADRLGITDEAALWGSASSLLYSTSVVPHAAYQMKRGELAMFNGSFSDILKSQVLNNCFRDHFLPSLKRLPDSTIFVGLGPTPQEALNWCVKAGHLRAGQVLGALPHPSRSAGSQIDIFLGLRDPEQLNSKDPVRHRVEWLQTSYREFSAKLQLMLPLPTAASG